MGSLPESARVVIVGGGIVGTSVAYHLAQHGWSDIVLVDQGPLWETGGSTSHAPGLVFQINPSPTMTRFAQDTVALFNSLELDGQPCFHPVGGIEVARTARALGRAAAPLGPRAVVRDPRRAARRRRRWPSSSRSSTPSVILGGLHTPDDGIAKAVRAAEAMARDAGEALRAFGALRGHRASTSRAGACARSTPRCGTIRADHVVVCAGIWGPQVAALAGADIPLDAGPAPVRASPRRCPSWPARRARSSIRSCATRTARCTSASTPTRYGIGNYRHEPLRGRARGDPPAGRRRCSRRSLPFTPERLRAARWAETGTLLPALGRAELAAHVQRHVLLHARRRAAARRGARDVAGLWMCEAIWVTHAGGAGKALAELMATATRASTSTSVDPQRFDGHGLSAAYARARGAQQYREVYDVIHPRQPQRAGARPLRRSPFHDREVALGAVMFESAGLGAPAVVRGQRRAADERRAGRAASGRRASGRRSPSPSTARPASGSGSSTSRRSRRSRSRARRAGLPAAPGRQRRRPAGRARVVYTAMLDAARRRSCATSRSRGSPRTTSSWSPAARSAGTTSAGCAATCPEDGSVHARATARRGSAASACGARGRATSSRASAEDDVSNDAFPYMSARELHVGHVPVRALRISYVGELGWELYAPPEFGAALWDTLWEAGAPHGVVAVRRRGLRLAAPREGLPAVGRRHRRGARPLRGRPRLRRQARQGRLHRPRRRRGRRRSAVPRGGCAA